MKTEQQRKVNPIPVMTEQCATCPFRNEGWTHVREFLKARALTEASPICHSTGRGALAKSVSERPMICRGARLMQARVFYQLGVISAPTVEAWEYRAKELKNKKR